MSFPKDSITSRRFTNWAIPPLSKTVDFLWKLFETIKQLLRQPLTNQINQVEKFEQYLSCKLLITYACSMCLFIVICALLSLVCLLWYIPVVPVSTVNRLFVFGVSSFPLLCWGVSANVTVLLLLGAAVVLGADLAVGGVWPSKQRLWTNTLYLMVFYYQWWAIVVKEYSTQVIK